MWPDGFEQLGFDDQVVLFRLNLRCAALLLLVSVVAVLDCGWQEQMLGVLASAGLAALADHAEAALRRLAGLIGSDETPLGGACRPSPREDRQAERS